MIGITENEDALWRWMIAVPEIALILSEYSSKIDKGVNHHEQTQSSQDCFVKDVKNLVNAFEDAGNPYMDGVMNCLHSTQKLLCLQRW